MSPSELAYVKRTERERQERHAKARAEGCPADWEDEWATSSKFRMMIRDRKDRP